MTNEDLSTSPTGVVVIQYFEGLRLKPYKCSAGKWTIGYGHTTIAPVLAQARIAITAEQAELLFSNFDLPRAETDLRRVVKVDLTQGQFDALVSFTFNFGVGKLGASTLLAKLNAGDYSGAEQEFGKWIYSSHVIEPGLVKRREAERRLFAGLNWKTAEKGNVA
jgi:lysozyme